MTKHFAMNFSMLSFLKKTCCLIALLVFGSPSAFGFSLLGPPPPAGSPEIWQGQPLGYGLGGTPPYPRWADLGAPKDFMDEYRRNVPVLYYTFDDSFYQYFGNRGVAAVDAAFAIYNNITNVSAYNADLSEFPLDSRRINFTARELSIVDLKSVTMGLMIEQLGLFSPSRWVWALQNRISLGIPGITCPEGMEYLVLKRNFDFLNPALDEVVYSSYVNNVLYSYFIAEFCTGTPLADAVEFPVDPLASGYSAVADFRQVDRFFFPILYPLGLPDGSFYTTLTRDDMRGLRHLLRTNNVNLESAGPRSFQFVTNFQPALIVSQDLGALIAQARTNDAATLEALFPGLIVASSTSSFGLAVATNISAYISNAPPTAPAGTFAVYFATNFTTNVIQLFEHNFANIVTNHFATRGFVTQQTIAISNSPYAPVGTPPNIVTNSRTLLVNMPVGDFFILPTNVCSASILSNILQQVVATTNAPLVGTNEDGTITFSSGLSTITYFTNSTLVYLPVTCPEDTVALRQGIERVRFVRRDFDSLVGQFFYPITNDYTMVALTNSTFVTQHMRRVVPRPDFLFSVVNLALNTAFTYSNTVEGATEVISVTISGFGPLEYYRTINFNQDNRAGNRNGPGTIQGGGLDVLPTLIIFNKTSPLYDNFDLFLTSTNFFLNDETTHLRLPVWGSFDGTTNPPIVYPNGVSIAEFEDQLSGPYVVTTSIPTAIIGQFYSVQLSAVGGQPPYTWSLAPVAGLPAGLNLSSAGVISGTPAAPQGIYDFTVRLTDSLGRHKDVLMTITLNP